MSVNVNGQALVSSDFPIGGVILWPTLTPPSGFLQLAGQTIQASAYPELVKVLTGSSSATSVTLPDMRGVIPAGTGYCSSRGSSGNVNGSSSLNILTFMGSKSKSISFTPSHTSNSQSISVPLPKHYHGYTVVSAVNYASDFDRTFNNTGVAGVSLGSAATTEAGFNNASITVNFPGHSSITKSIDVIPPIFGIMFIIKAKSE